MTIEYKGAPRSLYLIQRGPKYGEGWHPSLVPNSVHSVIVCTRRKAAKWQAGWTGDGAIVWERTTAQPSGEGFLLTRWNGLDIDYGHLVRGGLLLDGFHMGFYHPNNPEHRRCWDLLDGAVWWSTSILPDWLEKRGVRLPTDEHTIESIVSDLDA